MQHELEQDKESTLVRILEWIIAAYLVFSIGCIWLLNIDSLFYKYNTVIQMLAYACIMLWVLLNSDGLRHINGYSLIWTLICVVCTFIPAMANTDFILTAINRCIIPVMLGLMIYIFVPYYIWGRVIDRIVNIIIIVSSISLLFWVLGPALRVIHPSKTITFQWGKMKLANSYFGLYYVPLWQTSTMIGLSSYRNCGSFTEAPMFGFWLSIAYSLYRYKNKNRVSVIVVLLASIMTSASMTAMFFVVIYEFARYGLKIRRDGIKQLICLFIMLITSIIALVIINNMLTSKLESGSGQVRSDHLKASFRLFKLSFPLGIGIGNEEMFHQYETFKQGMSIGLPALFAQGGLGITIITIYPMLYFLYRSVVLKKWGIIAFLIGFLFLNIVTTGQLNSPFFFIFLMTLLYGDDLICYFLHDDVDTLEYHF